MENNLAFAKDGSISNPRLLKFSVGDLALPVLLTAQRSAPESNMIRVSWEKETHISGMRLKAGLMAVCYEMEHFPAMTPTGQCH